ncbi:MAG: DUF1636 domain-containing protein [Elainellaceae cyanobacterium]
MSQHTVFVCTTCASEHCTEQDLGISGGDRLLEQIQTLHQDWPLQEDVAIHPIKCFGICNQACAIALSAIGKNTYLLANLPVDREKIELIAGAILEYATQYFNSPDGLVNHMQCPHLLQKKALARIPPLPDSSNSC